MDVIVNADDLGISSEVNEAIFALMERGKVTSATIIANGPNVEEACAQVSRFPQYSFGAHLNITEFKPLTGHKSLEPLQDTNGELVEARIRQTSIDSALAEGIFQEFCAQIERLQSLGISISHVDSHNYALTIPKMLPILKRVERRFKIGKARITRNIYSDGLLGRSGLTSHALSVDPELGDRDVSRSVRIKKWAYNFLLRKYVGMKTTDGFSGFRLFYESAKDRRLSHRTFEVNVHPASTYYDAGEEELVQGAWTDGIRFPIRLISYNDLGLTRHGNWNDATD